MTEEIEGLVRRCRDSHGGFQHGNHVGFCHMFRITCQSLVTQQETELKKVIAEIVTAHDEERARNAERDTPDQWSAGFAYGLKWALKKLGDV